MNLQKILAVVLAVATVGTLTVTALAAADSSGSETKITRAMREGKNIDPFKKLLDGGVVSQATYEKMKAYLEENKPQKSERQEKKAERTNILDKLLEEKIITQTEYDALKAAASAALNSSERPARFDKSQRINFLDKYVADGIISEKTAEAIKEYLKSNVPQKTEIKERIKEHSDMFSNMLEAGAITQAEYDDIKAAMQEHPILTKWRDRNADK